jgi:hypothetical protein
MAGRIGQISTLGVRGNGHFIYFWGERPTALAILCVVYNKANCEKWVNPLGGLNLRKKGGCGVERMDAHKKWMDSEEGKSICRSEGGGGIDGGRVK